MDSREAKLRLELKSLLATVKSFYDECLKFPERKHELRIKQKENSYLMSRSYVYAKQNQEHDEELKKIISEIDEIVRFFDE